MIKNNWLDEKRKRESGMFYRSHCAEERIFEVIDKALTVVADKMFCWLPDCWFSK